MHVGNGTGCPGPRFQKVGVCPVCMSLHVSSCMSLAAFNRALGYVDQGSWRLSQRHPCPSRVESGKAKSQGQEMGWIRRARDHACMQDRLGGGKRVEREGIETLCSGIGIVWNCVESGRKRGCLILKSSCFEVLATGYGDKLVWCFTNSASQTKDWSCI